MRKFFAFVLTMALVFTAFSSTTAFAAEVEAKENLIVITDSESNIGVTSTKGLRSYSGTMVGGSSYSFYLNNVGPNPTFVFYIEDEETYQNECPKCGGHLRRAIFLNDLWICEDCGAEAKEDDYGLLWTENDEDEEE